MIGLFLAFMCLDLFFEKNVQRSRSLVRKDSGVSKCTFYVEDVNTWLSEGVKPLDVFYKSRRFDLIYKIMWAQTVNFSKSVRAFSRNNYLQSIECSGLNLLKKRPEIFLRDFDELLKNISENGFDDKLPITLSENGEVVDGAHRLAACIALGRNITIKSIGGLQVEGNMDYRWFLRHGLSSSVADWGALEYIKLNPNTFIFNVFPVLPISFDRKVEDILDKYGFVYYKKSLSLTLIGCINIKRISYGSEAFADDAFFQKNAKDAMGGLENGTLRALVFVGRSLKCVYLAKKEIRNLLNIGNSPVHSSDFKEEIVELAETYFNGNLWLTLNYRPFNSFTHKPEGIFVEFRKDDEKGKKEEEKKRKDHQNYLNRRQKEEKKSGREGKKRKKRKEISK